MTSLFNIEINVYFENDEAIQVDKSLVDMFKVSRETEKLLGKNKKWFFTGYSKKDAMKSVAFDKSGPTVNALNIVNKHYNKHKPLINESIWDGGKEGDSCSISHYIMFIQNPNKGMLVIGMDERINDIEKMISMVNYLACSRMQAYITVDSKGYHLHKRNVFPDRIYVGWMIYIPAIILPELIPEAARIEPVMVAEKQKGTIVISTEDVFDGNNKEHIGKANDIEIRLLDLGLLPLMTEL